MAAIDTEDNNTRYRICSGCQCAYYDGEINNHISHKTHPLTRDEVVFYLNKYRQIITAARNIKQLLGI